MMEIRTDWYYYELGIECLYNTEHDCEANGCDEEGICRCGRITSIEVKKSEYKSPEDITYDILCESLARRLIEYASHIRDGRNSVRFYNKMNRNAHSEVGNEPSFIESVKPQMYKFTEKLSFVLPTMEILEHPEKHFTFVGESDYYGETLSPAILMLDGVAEEIAEQYINELISLMDNFVPMG